MPTSALTSKQLEVLEACKLHTSIIREGDPPFVFATFATLCRFAPTISRYEGLIGPFLRQMILDHGIGIAPFKALCETEIVARACYGDEDEEVLRQVDYHAFRAGMIAGVMNESPGKAVVESHIGHAYELWCGTRP